MLHYLKSSIAFLVLAGSCAVLTGCGGNSGRYAVEGTITYDGKPLPEGQILFVPQDVKTAGAGAKAVAEIKDGRYAISAASGLNPGKHKVYITWQKKTGRQVMSNDPPNMKDETVEVLPKVYNDRTTLSADIREDANKVDFALVKQKNGSSSNHN
jgi:hypothetical protein